MGVASSRAQTRLVGLDVARFLALLGMMATHLLATRDEAGDPTWVAEVFSGRASALFALLAGVSLALMTGGSRPVRGEERVARSAGLLVRALAVGVVGLLLGGIDLARLEGAHDRVLLGRSHSSVQEFDLEVLERTLGQTLGHRAGIC